MSSIEFPEPPVGPEVLGTEFLQGVQPSIDVMAGSPKWLLAGLAIGSLGAKEEIAIPALAERVHGMWVPDAAWQKNSQFVSLLYSRFHAAGMITLSRCSAKGAKIVHRTQKAKDNLALVGALTASQLVGGLPLGTTLGRTYQQWDQAVSPYPYAPTRRLRVAQLVVTEYAGVLFTDVQSVLRVDSKPLVNTLTRMCDANVLWKRAINARKNYYQLNEAIWPSAVNLLGAIASVQNPAYADYARALSGEAMKLLDAEHGKRLRMSLVEGWDAPLPQAGVESWIDGVVDRHYDGVAAQRKAKDGAQWLMHAGLITIADKGHGTPFALHAELQAELSTLEQRLLTIGHGVELLVFGDRVSLTQYDRDVVLRRAGVANPQAYMREYLTPKAIAIVRENEMLAKKGAMDEHARIS
ncbi:MAG TPA: hypothetical protein VLE73_06585 [Candidatus Saccharimonadales bacterium]|nr:hypothetical protein [Candidatus Saccharimonadales bacterium]